MKLATESKFWVYYPIPNYKESIPSMAYLADKLGIKRCTLSEYKRRRTCIGSLGRAYVVDWSFSSKDIEEIRAKVIKKVEKDEEWAPIGEHEYYVSTYGRVKSVKQRKEKMLSQSLRGGSLSVTLRLKMNNNKPVSYYVHRLVAEAFLIKNSLIYIKDRLKEYVVVHLNGKKYDNCVTNLLLVKEENLAELGFLNGLGKPVIKIDAETNEELEYFDSMSEASRATGIAIQGISSCVLGYYNTSGGFKWSLDPCAKEENNK